MHGVFAKGCHECKVAALRDEAKEKDWPPEPPVYRPVDRSLDAVTPWADPKSDPVADVRAEIERGREAYITAPTTGPATLTYVHPHDAPPIHLSSGDSTSYMTGTGGITSGWPITPSPPYPTTVYGGTVMPPEPKVIVIDPNGNELDLSGMVLNLEVSYERSLTGPAQMTMKMQLRDGVTVAKTPDRIALTEQLTFRDETEHDALRLPADIFDPDDYDPEDGTDPYA